MVKGTLHLGENSLIRSGTYIEGLVMIGRDCEIGPTCHIRPFICIGNGCHIGAGSVVANSVIMSGSILTHLNCVADSIIGRNCSLGSETHIAYNGKNRGAIMGDGVQTGNNTSIAAGNLIGNNTTIGPGATIHGNVGPGTEVQ